MTPELLQAILRHATGLSEKGNAFRTGTGTRVTLYLGSDAGSMAVQEVSSVALHDNFVEICATEPGTIFARYEMVNAIAVKPPKDTTGSRAGFA